MTWSYTGNPGDSTKDEVRFLMGDTDPNNQLLTDEEIAYLLLENGSVYFAASAGCSTIATNFAKRMSRTVGTLSISYQQQVDGFTTLAAELRRRGALHGGGPVMTQEDDTVRVSKGMHDNPGDVIEVTDLTST